MYLQFGLLQFEATIHSLSYQRLFRRVDIEI